jgi:hypothetical protein
MKTFKRPPIIEAYDLGMDPIKCSYARNKCPLIHINNEHAPSTKYPCAKTCPSYYYKWSPDIKAHAEIEHDDDPAKIQMDAADYESVISDMRSKNNALFMYNRDLTNIIAELRALHSPRRN